MLQTWPHHLRTNPDPDDLVHAVRCLDNAVGGHLLPTCGLHPDGGAGGHEAAASGGRHSGGHRQVCLLLGCLVGLGWVDLS